MVETEFRASHGLRLGDGCREETHQHCWKVRAAVSCPQLNQIQMGMDFRDIRVLLEEIAGSLAGHSLERHEAFAPGNATTERLAKFFYDRLAPKLPPVGKLEWVEITEAPGYAVRYKQD